MFVASAFAASAQDAAEATHSETGVAPDGAHGPSFPPFDSSTFPSQLLWLAITFGLFYLFLKRVVLPRIGGILEVRRDRIAQDLDQAARMKEDADQAVAAYEQELADARKKANVIGQEARDAAKAEADAERQSVEKELEAKLGEAEKRIATIKDTAMKDVGTIAEDTAAAIVQELVGGRLDKTAAAAAVKALK
ncbi:F0F1 ATP synthase subunit B [Nitratireductor sp. ZSWI3]|uniref:F0F1 ATP synthase subunit B n=1 Tax=Nitratireductor sp. ZSWI3 TaxID=2966359 RepID=UPI00214FBA46|nr:F0F1 ATP synthase subunit B [Nitratireductor sp. ZSWI3]MCR4268633.1 F0F1 ATP synthase subunit B [Nitratireductor sp. ZSWI3]